MKKPWLILLLLIAAAGFGLTCRAFGQSSTDETVQQDLNTAKSGRTSAVNQAVATMSAAFDAQIRALSATGDADSARILSTQKAAFVAGGTLPQSPLMGQAVTQYQYSIKAANDDLVVAYGTAISGFDRESRLDLASQARRDRNDLLTAPAWANAAGGASSSVLTPESIAHELEAAKTQHRQSIDDAKKALLDMIDQRVTAATDAGDLAGVEALQAVQATAAVDGTVPDNVKDASVAAAKRKYESSLVQAGVRLKLAYQKAIRDYTRARQLPMAQTTQSEMNSLDLVDTTAPSAMTAGTYQLGSKLPDFLTAKDSIFVPLGDRYGIAVPETQYIRTQESDLLNKNFTFDVWFYLMKGMRYYPKLPAALVGLGDGTTNLINGGPQDSLYLEINPPDRNGGEVNLHQRQASTKTTIGHLKEFDTYVVRIQKSGNAVTFIVGTEQSGTLVPEVSVTVGDVRSESPYLNDQNGHLFFGSGAFRQLSIGKGPPPVTAIASAPPLANPSESNFNTTTEVPQGSILDLKFNPQNVDSTDATMVHDLSAVHHAAMLQNVPIVKNLETGWAAEFNGKDSSVSLGNDPVFQMSGGITVAARIRPTGAKKDAEHIVAKEDWENRTTNGYVLRLLDGKPEFTIGMNGWQGIESGNDLDRNKWHTIAGSFDGNTMKLYVDGEMVASRAVHGLISPSKYPLVIGNSPFDDKRRFEGEISEVWLANQAWPSEIISQLANRQIVSASGRTTDLLKMIDLSRDVVSGSWQLQNGVLISDKSDPAKLQLPYHPPEEYDFKIVFTPISGEEKVIQICQAGGHQFLLQIGSTHNSVYGFDGINGTGENPTVRRTDNWIKNGQEYTSIIKVRKTGVQSFLDGKLISEWATDYHDMSLYEGWKLKTYNSIGIGSALRPTKFEAIEVTEISGS